MQGMDRRLIKPTLTHWEMLYDHDPQNLIQLQNSYQAICTLFPDGKIDLKSDPEGRLRLPFNMLEEWLKEARNVARHYYGDKWGA